MAAPESTHENFAAIKPPLSVDHALAEANRCLYCYDAPCTQACPTHIEVPEFIRRIATRNTKGAASVILKSNPLGASCARVCPTEVLCEGACVYHGMAMPPIQIGLLQRFATDYVMAEGSRVLDPPAESARAPVAVVGGGPAGLACAVTLRLLGHRVVVFDAAPEPGGLNRYGIAPYKLTNEEARAEVEYLQKMTGFEIRSGVRVGQDVPFSALEAEFGAVFLAVGLGETRPLGIPGENVAGVVGAIDFIADLRSHPLHEKQVGRRVAVIGAGNTAIDAATEAVRLGAEEVTIVYRRGQDEKPCHEHEYALALRDGVHFKWHTQPIEIIGNGLVTGLRCVLTAPGEPDASGRARPVALTDSIFQMPVDMVINASGQSTRDALLKDIGGIATHGGRIVVDADHRTTNPKYFAGGDCVNGGQEVVNAVAEGQAAARAIHECLAAVKEGV